MTISSISPRVQPLGWQKEGPLASTYPELLQIIFSTRGLYVPPFVVKRAPDDVRSVIHTIMAVSKRWNRIMRELIVPLNNNHTIDWSYLPGVQCKLGGMNPIYKFLSYSNRGEQVTRLQMNDIIEMNADRLGEIVRLCKNIQVLSIAGKMFDINHLLHLPRLKHLDLDKSVPLNVSVLGELPSLEVLKINRCHDNPTWTHLNSSTSLKRLTIHSLQDQSIEGVPSSLESLTLFKTYFTVEDAFQSLSQLKHLSFSCFDAEPPSLKTLSALESLEIACEELPEGYIDDVLQIKRLKISFSQNLPFLVPFKNLTHLFLNRVNDPQIGSLENLFELKMVNCSYSSLTLKGMSNLKKLTLDNWKTMPEEVSFNHVPLLEVLSIRSNRLIAVRAYMLTNLVYFKANCVGLKELTLPIDLSMRAKIHIRQKVNKRFINNVPQHEVLLF